MESRKGYAKKLTVTIKNKKIKLKIQKIVLSI